MDEVCEDILFDGTRHPSIISCPEMEKITALVSGASKTYSWTGGRIVRALSPAVEEAETGELFKQQRHPCTKALLASVLTPEPRVRLTNIHLGVVFPNPIDPPSGCAFHPRCPKATEFCSIHTPELKVEKGRRVECHFPERAEKEQS